MTTEQPLLAAIIAGPADDSPRPIFADRLDDHADAVPCPDREKKPGEINHPPGVMFVGRGHGRQPCARCDGSAFVPDGRPERAEFIRVQCETARIEVEIGGCRPADRGEEWAALRRRGRELWEGSGAAWLPASFDEPIGGAYPQACLSPAASRTDSGPPGVLFRRGFIPELRGPLAAFRGWCGRCDGTGRLDNPALPRGRQYCPHCSGAGTGRLSGPTAAFRESARTNPVERVAVTDRSPVGHPSGFIGWVRADAGQDPYRLRRSVFDPLPPTGTDPHARTRSYPTRAAAEAALSAAPVAAARGGGN